MGRSKLAGKMVNELTERELPEALELCQQMLRMYPSGPANKLLLKRRHEIEKRLERAREMSDRT